MLRTLFYTWLKLPEPSRPATTRPIPVPAPPEPPRRLPHEPALFVTASRTDPDEVTLRRYPAAHQRTQIRHLAGAHLTADPDDPDPSRPRSADVLLLPLGRTAHPGEPRWTDFAARFPGSGLVAVEEPDSGCLLLRADGTRLRATWTRRPPWATFALAASAAYVWLTSSPVSHAGTHLHVRTGDGMEPGTVTLTSAPLQHPGDRPP